jgi:hypothetical protein
MQNKQAELDQQMKEVEGMSTPSDWGDTDEGDTSLITCIAFLENREV